MSGIYEVGKQKPRKERFHVNAQKIQRADILPWLHPKPLNLQVDFLSKEALSNWNF